MSKKPNSYLSLRGETYWYKRDYPAALRPQFDGKTACLTNLHTSDLKEAKQRRDEANAVFVRDLAAARKGDRVAGAVDEVAELAATWIAEKQAYAKDELAWTAKILGRDPSTFADEETLSVHEFIQDAGERLKAEKGEAASARFANLVQGRGPIDQYLDNYLGETTLAPKTKAERRNLVRAFTRWAESEGLSLPQVKRPQAGRYVTEHIATKNRITAKKHLGSLRGYWAFLVGRGLVSGENPWSGQMTPDSGKRAERGDEVEERAFTDDEIKTLLYSDWPDGLAPRFESQIRDAMHIAALSGMRLAEIVTLLVSECQHGVFAVSQGKTKAARRDVPIHSDSAEIVARRTKGKKPGDWLFDELANERDAGDIFGKRFGRYRVALGVDDAREGKRRSLVNFHSFRRWFATKAEQAGQSPSTLAAVLGHSETGRETLAFKVYSDGPHMAQTRACVEAVRLPDGA